MIQVFVATLIRRVQAEEWGFVLATGDYGVFISYTKGESPAELAGLKRGDRILGVNGAQLAPDSRAWFVDLNCRFGVECRLLIERDPEGLKAERSIGIARALSGDGEAYSHSFEQEEETRNEVVETLHLQDSSDYADQPGEDPYLSKFLKRMRLGMPIPGETPNFEISERTRNDLEQLVEPEQEPEYRRPPERILEYDDDSRFSDRQLLKMVGSNKILAPDDHVSNFIAITREEHHKGEIRKQRERLEFKKQGRLQGLVLTRRERKRLPSFDAPDENAPSSILDADPTARQMFQWMGRGMYNDFS